MIRLQYETLYLHAGPLAILGGIDLDLAGPGIVALLGPSGVGKSSLLRVTQRLIEHGQNGWRRSGDIRFNGESIFSPKVKKQKLARRIGFIHQKPRMLHGSVLDNVEFALKHTTRHSRRRIRQIAKSVLEQVGLAQELGRLDREAWQLSGGQAQRLALARALALDPEVILMDEPSSALDPLKSQCVENIIRTVASDRLIVLVTHDITLAERLADFVAFMFPTHSGAQIVEFGEAERVLHQPTHPEARKFVQIVHERIQGKRLIEERLPPIVSEEEMSPKIDVPFFSPALCNGLLQRVYLFICNGNTSRSPIAQVICNDRISRLLKISEIRSSEQIKIQAYSAGLSPKANEPMSTPAQVSLEKLGFSSHTHFSRPVTEDLIQKADSIFCMTNEQCRSLVQRFPTGTKKVQRLDPISDIEDPSEPSSKAFIETVKRIRDAVYWHLGRDLKMSHSPE